MRVSKYLAVAFAASAAAGSLACGSLGDPSARPTLATIHGELTTPNPTSFQPTPTGGGIRVAVVWIGMTGAYSVAQDLPVQPVFPSQFRIDLNAPPPDQVVVTKAKLKAMTSSSSPPPDGSGPTPSPAPPSSGGAGGGSGGVNGLSHPLGMGYDGDVARWPDDFGFAMGAVVAYEDLNGNGKLDLVDDGATAYVDRIVGANDAMILVWFEGTLPPDAVNGNSKDVQFADDFGNKPTVGYDLFSIAPETCTQANDPITHDPMPTCTRPPTQWLSMSALYTLPLTADPKWSSLMCKNSGTSLGSGGGSAGSTPPSTPSAPGPTGGSAPNGGAPSSGGAADAGAVPPSPSLPSPSDPKLQCAADGRSFTYDCHPTPPPQPKLCDDSPLEGTTSCGAWVMPSPPPPNWPCPVH